MISTPRLARNGIIRSLDSIQMNTLLAFEF